MDRTEEKEQISIVMAGHVDHGKSTVIGRLLADIQALPQGKLEQVRAQCRRNAKPFEYAFLLDALKDEQSQGITIDAARCFFKTDQRRYILIDAPGHIEFLKNMITGAARAEAALLVIDAQEGIQENSKRHGYMMSMLGLRQMAVLVNKMDLVGYDPGVFDSVCKEYGAFLERIGIQSVCFIPVSGMAGVNIAARSKETPWYRGPTMLEQIDAFRHREFPGAKPFRLPVQDVYKFTGQGDRRRIVAGTIETGSVAVGDPVLFLPSRKPSRVKSIEYFNGPEKRQAVAGEACGYTLETQVYIRPGEWMVKEGEKPMRVSTRMRVNLFWMGHSPMIRDKIYKLKLGAQRSPVKLVEVMNLIDATELSSVTRKQQVDRHDVAEVVLETPKPVAFDRVGDIEETGRLVIVDEHEIAGAGIVPTEMDQGESTLREHIRAREIAWKPSAIPRNERVAAYGHGAKFVALASEDPSVAEAFARSLEQRLFAMNYKVCYLGMENMARGLDADLGVEGDLRDDPIRRLGELARILTDSGLIFIASIAAVDDYDLKTLELLNSPNEILTVHIGENHLDEYRPSLEIDDGTSLEAGVGAMCALLRDKNVILEYQI